jgi:hypothetical protein
MQIDGAVGSANRVPLSAGRSAVTADGTGPGVRCAGRSANCRLYCYRPMKDTSRPTTVALDPIPFHISCLGGLDRDSQLGRGPR